MPGRANRKVCAVNPTFGIFDHIEDIPGTPTQRLFQDRLALVKLADEAGFESFHLAEHHGSGLCMAPSQEIFIGAASQVTTKIRLGPMVKLLPLHHPGPDHRGHVHRRSAHGRPSRLRRRPRRRADRARLVRQQMDGVEGALRGHARASSATRLQRARSRAPGARTTISRPCPSPTKPLQDPIPFWYPGNPVTAGRHGMSLMCAGCSRPQSTYDAYVESWERHRADTLRLDGPDSRPRVGCTLILAIAPSEKEALAISRRGVDGLVRRTKRVHTYDHLVLSEAECERRSRRCSAILAHIEDDSHRSAPACRSRSSSGFAAMLEPGLDRPHRAPGADRRHDATTRRGAPWSCSPPRSSRSSRSSSAPADHDLDLAPQRGVAAPPSAAPGGVAAREQAGVAEALAARGERRRRPAPAEVVDVAEQRRVGPERREILEQQRQLALARRGRRAGTASIGAVLVEESRRRRPRRCRGCPGSRRRSRRPARGSPGSAQARRRTSHARPRRCGSCSPRRSTCTTRSPRTHCARSLSGVQMQTCSTLVVSGGDARGGRERVVGLELDHRPDRDAHRRERVLERMELRAQRRVDAVAGLVAGPEVVAERLDDVVGRDADVRRARLDHLQHRVEHADHGAERLVVTVRCRGAGRRSGERARTCRRRDGRPSGHGTLADGALSA